MKNDLTRRNFLGTASAAVAAGAVSTAVAADTTDAASNAGRIKILAIGCSPREESTTAASLQVCLDAARNVAPDRIEVELIKLAGMRINGSLAAGVPLEEGERDDFPNLVPKLSDPAVAGMIIVGESRPTAHFGPGVWNNRELDRVTDDEVGMGGTRNLGRRVAQVALTVAGA